MVESIIIYGTWGRLVVNARAGTVISRDYNDRDQPQYDNILRFNLKEYRRAYRELHDRIDILDIGYITDTGHYEPPAQDWRERFRNQTAPDLIDQ